MKTPQQLKEYVAQHSGWSISRMYKALHRQGVTRENLRMAMNGLDSNAVQNHVIPKTIGQPLANLINQFDDVSKVAKAMKVLAKDNYLEDDEMRRSLSINPDRWKAVCQHPSLVAFRFALPKGNKHVWMHQTAQEKLTSAINLDQQ